MLVLSLVIGPPEGPCFAVSLRVRSGLITCQLRPSVTDLKSTCAPMYRSFGFVGDSTMGKVHWKRYLSAAAPHRHALSHPHPHPLVPLPLLYRRVKCVSEPAIKEASAALILTLERI